MAATPVLVPDNYLWNHVYGKTRINGTKTFYRFHDYGQCITVTGTVYSSAGTTQEPDGDLHFTLQLDPQYEHYSNQFDPQCIPHGGSGTPCKNIIVEVICHNAIDSSYNKFGDYCKGVNMYIHTTKSLPKVTNYLLAEMGPRHRYDCGPKRPSCCLE